MTMPRIASSTVASPPTTGRGFKRLRALAVGATVHDVATRLGVNSTTLTTWEMSTRPVPAERATAWRVALAAAAEARRERLAREGLDDNDLAGSPLADALAALSISATAEGGAR